MRKFLTLCVVMSLMFFFTTPALTATVNKVDLGSNLSFTFEPSSTAEKSLIIIPFSNFDLSLAQEEPAGVKKDDSLPIVFGIGVVLVTAFCLSQAL